MGLLDKWVATAQTKVKEFAGAQYGAVPKSNSTTDPSITQATRDYLVMIKQDQDVPTVPGMGKDPMMVVGQIASDFQIDQQVRWQAPWGAGLMGEGTMADVLAATSGNRLVAQVLTLQVWQGAGNDIDFTVSFELRAWSSTERDVMTPLRYLLAMSMPSMNDAGFLISPGPILDADAMKKLGQAVVQATTVAAEATVEGFKAGAAALGSTKDGTAESLIATAQTTSKKVQNAFGTIAKKDTVEQLMKNKISVSIGNWFALSNVVITGVQHTLKPQMPGPDGGLMAADVTVTFRPMFALTTNDIPSILRRAKTFTTFGTSSGE